jgi:hypothetical protein
MLRPNLYICGFGYRCNLMNYSQKEVGKKEITNKSFIPTSTNWLGTGEIISPEVGN